MRSRAHIEGHPLHPMLIPFPFAYLFGAVCVDLAAFAADRPGWYPTARHMRVLGIASALVAAECPWHGSQFDVRTGTVAAGPAEQAIAVHEVRETAGRVRLRLRD